MLVAEWWWIGAAGVGTGALGWAGYRRQRGPRARRLAVDAARHDVREAQRALARTRAQVKVAQAELLEAKAQRGAAGAVAGATTTARRSLQAAERSARAAAASLRARRAAVTAARASMPRPRTPVESLPLARLRARHDALTARWIAYETDPALAVEVPQMSDPASPSLRTFLRAQQRAMELRPARADAPITPAEFSAYREAVALAARTFEAAEREARGGTRRAASARERGEWGALAQHLVEAARSALEQTAQAWDRRDGARGADR